MSINSKFMIPKIIHQIWSDKKYPLPTYLQEWGETWRTYNPEWDYMFWDNEKIHLFIKENFPEYVETFYSFRYDIQNCDAIRYLILLKYGGLYVDFDYECLEPLDDIFISKTCCFSMEPKESYNPLIKNNSLNFNNAMIACEPNHPFILKLINKVFCSNQLNSVETSKAEYVLTTTGPVMVVKTYEEYPNKDDIYLIPAEFVSPFNIIELKLLYDGFIDKSLEVKLQKAKAIHYFLGLWKK